MAEMIKPLAGGGSGAEPARGDVSTRGVTSEVTDVATQAKQMVGGTVTRQAERSANDLSDVARALRQTREQLGGNMAAPLVDKAADQLERLSRFVRTADANQMLHGVESFARREPIVFLGGAFALGMLGARFLKSSGQGGRSRRGEDVPYTRPYPFGAEIPRTSVVSGGAPSAPDYGATSGATSGIAGDTGPRGVVGPLPGSTGPGATAPDPRGDYPPIEPGTGPFPGGGAGGNVGREGRGRMS